MNWWNQIDHQRGSQPRCLLMVNGPRKKIAASLTKLINLPDVIILPENQWMPYGLPVQKPDNSWDLRPAKEIDLVHDVGLIQDSIRLALKKWWLAVNARARTPNWDFAAQCLVNGKPGLLLIEAKAHVNELENAGKRAPTSHIGKKNHVHIGQAIEEARKGLEASSGKEWAISRDHHYQVSNRFAWSWKLASLGIPVVLVYLGFINAGEMKDRGPLIDSQQTWERTVKGHTAEIMDPSHWENIIHIGKAKMIALIRSYQQPFPN